MCIVLFCIVLHSPIQQRCEEWLDFLKHCILGIIRSMHSGGNKVSAVSSH